MRSTSVAQRFKFRIHGDCGIYSSMGVSVITGFTEAQVERLTGVSQRQLRYWARDGFFVPSLKSSDPDLAPMRLYSFRDLVCLKVLSDLSRVEEGRGCWPCGVAPFPFRRVGPGNFTPSLSQIRT